MFRYIRKEKKFYWETVYTIQNFYLFFNVFVIEWRNFCFRKGAALVSEEGQISPCCLSTSWRRKETKCFISPAEVARKWMTTGQFCDQSKTTIHVGFGIAKQNLRPYYCYVCVLTSMWFKLYVCVCVNSLYLLWNQYK